MKSTERKASVGMIGFVVVILVIAMIIACGYIFLLTPGEVSTS